jgi:hypothetical protein
MPETRFQFFLLITSAFRTNLREKAGGGGSTPSLAISKNFFELPGMASVRCRSASETRVKRQMRISMSFKALS